MDHQAFAQLLGNYGEFVGAIAVVVTLGYLAIQIRQNTRSQHEHRKAVIAQSSREIDLYLANWHLEVAKSDALKRIMQNSQPMNRRREDYGDLEWYELHCLAASLFFPFQSQYIHGELQVGHDEQRDYQLAIAKGMVSNIAVWRDWWDQQQEDRLFAPSFMKAVNDYSGFVPSAQNVFPDGQ